MWWEPFDRESRELSISMTRLVDGYRTHVVTREHQYGQMAWGIGSAPGDDSVWNRPLVLASYEGGLCGTPC